MDNKTVDDLFHAYINSYKVKANLKESTVSTYTYRYNCHLQPYYGRLSPTKITETSIIEYTNMLLKEHSAKTVRDILSLLNNILAYGKIDIMIYKPSVKVKEIGVLNDDGWDRLIRYCSTHLSYLEIGMLIVIFTGMRIGEICALKRENIDFGKGIIKIRSTMQRIKNLDQNAKTKTKIILDIPKSPKAERDIPVNAFLLNLFIYYYENLPADAYLLTGKPDKFMEPRLVSYHYKKFLKKLDIEDINFHALRHTFATHFYRETHDTKALADILGHANVCTTLNTYVHADMENKRNLIEKTFIRYDKIS